MHEGFFFPCAREKREGEDEKRERRSNENFFHPLSLMRTRALTIKEGRERAGRERGRQFLTQREKTSSVLSPHVHTHVREGAVVAAVTKEGKEEEENKEQRKKKRGGAWVEFMHMGEKEKGGEKIEETMAKGEEERRERR